MRRNTIETLSLLRRDDNHKFCLKSQVGNVEIVFNYNPFLMYLQITTVK